MTKLKRTVERETSATVFEQGKRRAVVVALDPSGFIVFRLKGTRRRFELGVVGLYHAAVKAHVAATQHKQQRRGSARRGATA